MSNIKQNSYVNFFCQECRKPIKLEPSLLEGTSERLFALLPDKSMDDEGSRNLKSNLKTGDPLTLIEKPTESFVVLSTTSTSNVLTAESVNRASLSFRLKVVKKIFDIISGKNEIDHPLCNDCAKILNEKLKQNLDKIKKEIVSYQSYYDQLRLNIRNSPEETETEIDINAEEEEINKLKSKQKSNSETLEMLEKQLKELEIESTKLDQESKELDEREQELLKKANLFQQIMDEYNDNKESVEINLKQMEEKLVQLRKANAYNDTFRIEYDGAFGTINGFRLGRLPSYQIDLCEINAAFGQTLLLLYSLAKKTDFSFKNYRLIPNGSYSRIEKIDDNSSYDFFIRENAFGRIFKSWRNEKALLVFLECLKQFSEYLENNNNTDRAFQLTYKIEQDKIGDVSVKSKEDEIWTKALKYILIDLRNIAIHVT
ncbi:APG6-domain-containing protein [Neocallimastix lanati (nom. inval.)]|jgi:beclin 1|uniref:APG6-domain-containing protein n=1 Tax=Neocallimastix californiae TaxID=1754190 RepID=A0A1Y2FMH6_9FUNG|nr:APG6-domain-containing protein [Neocallimastix sp. JGI-2020a]ORY85183.1 APG6-domain-containing protein [Neocallimastix californiae]|eukprot:ORY85183.1 APG6-domain-containing protein [Neocallimastix californiae]